MNRKLLISLGWNLLFVVGVLLIAFGFWLAWHPLGFIVAGLLLSIIGYGGGFEFVRKAGRGR